MFNLSTLDAFKIQKCPGSCQLVFFTVGPMTIRIRTKVFREMVTKLNSFVQTELPSQGPKPEKEVRSGLALVK